MYKGSGVPDGAVAFSQQAAQLCWYQALPWPPQLRHSSLQLLHHQTLSSTAIYLVVGSL